jgi:hypothetical protein
MLVDEHAPASPEHPASAAVGSHMWAVVSPALALHVARHAEVMFPLALEVMQQIVPPVH